MAPCRPAQGLAEKGLQASPALRGGGTERPPHGTRVLRSGADRRNVPGISAVRRRRARKGTARRRRGGRRARELPTRRAEPCRNAEKPLESEGREIRQVEEKRRREDRRRKSPEEARISRAPEVSGTRPRATTPPTSERGSGAPARRWAAQSARRGAPRKRGPRRLPGRGAGRESLRHDRYRLPPARSGSGRRAGIGGSDRGGSGATAGGPKQRRRAGPGRPASPDQPPATKKPRAAGEGGRGDPRVRVGRSQAAIRRRPGGARPGAISCRIMYPAHGAGRAVAGPD